MELKNNNNLENNLNNNFDLEKNQNKFLNNMLGQAINTGLDIGIRALLPDFVEEQVINIKDNFINYGLKDGLSKTIQDAIDVGKSAIGIITGKFENVNQMQMAVKKGGLIDNFSDLFDTALEKIADIKEINNDITNLIKQGKNSILNNVEKNIEKSFSNQLKEESDLSKYINKWKEAYNNQDFSNMEKAYKKINKEMEKLVPLENAIKESRIIENLHTLIKTNGYNFNLSETEQELVNKLY